MKAVSRVIDVVIKKHGYDKSEGEKVTKEQVISEMDPQTIQLMAAMPKGLMDSVWKALGINE